MNQEHSRSKEWPDLEAFAHPQRARQDLERLHSRAPSGLVAALIGLLEDLPDPDQALSLFERFAAQSSDSILALLEKDRILLHHLLVLFSHSYWLGEFVRKNADILYSLQREKNLERSLAREEYREHFARLRSRSLETDLSLLLARFKKREYIRITLRDVLGIATLADTTAEISALADVLIEEALQEAQRAMRHKHGIPEYQDAQGRMAEAPFAVLSLGKLGGNELNYSSDVDLFYLYEEHEAHPRGEAGAALSLREYFVRQAQMITDILSRSTPEGAVFRVDLRLRPQGSEGEPAISLQHALNYYAHAAHDWELQALIKVRLSAGNAALAREFTGGVQGHVYTPNINFAAIETAVHSREKIVSRRPRLVPPSVGRDKEPDTIDVKLDRGGIRDIEFLVQCLQRVYGGEERWLRSGGTLFSLQKLHDKGHISGKDFHELTQAYEFLRRVEHRLQQQRGQQLHRLPAGREELQVLCRSVERDTKQVGVEAFLFGLQEHMARVAEIYQRVIHSQRQQRQQQGKRDAAKPLALASAATAGEMSLSRVLERIGSDSPELRDIAAQSDLSLHARRNLHRFLSSAMTSAERYAALLEDPRNVAKALPLFESSDYLTDILVRHPDAIRALGAIGREADSSIKEAASGEVRCLPALLDREEHDPGDSLARLRRSFRMSFFAIGAEDVLAPRPALDSMRAATQLADQVIRQALAIANGTQFLAVFALGRLGTEEFDIASDADLLFVHPPGAGDEEARTAAERMVHALAAYTREGSIFAVDARLRPRGGEGELVVTPDQVGRYLNEEAQPWEALTYTKLRFIGGREDLAPSVITEVWHQIVEMAARPGFAQAVAGMRLRLEKSNRYPHSFKLARGGFYDIDFLASYLMLRHASLCQGNTLERLEHLRQRKFLDQAEFEILRDATLLYRTADHVIRLVTGRARPELPAAEHARAAVEALVNQILGQGEPANLQRELNATAERVRAIFQKVIAT